MQTLFSLVCQKQLFSRRRNLVDRKRSLKASKHIANIRGLRICICCEPDSHYGGWILELQRSRVEITKIWPPPPGRLSADMDILICDYFPRLGELLPWTPGEASAALIVVLPQNGQYDDDLLLSAAPQCVLQRPFFDALISTTTKVAWSQFRYEQRLLKRVSKLDENVRAVRDVERAKLIIMEEKNIDAEAAYRHLRDLAMHRQLTVSSLATAIVDRSSQAF